MTTELSETALDRFCAATRLDRSDVEGLGALDDAQYELLAVAYDAARCKRAKDLGEAAENSLSVVPRLVRPAVRKIISSQVGGGKKR